MVTIEIIKCAFFPWQEKLELWLFRVREALEKAMTKKQDFHLNTGECCIIEIVNLSTSVACDNANNMLCNCLKLHS